jgi:hypothetical protein
MYDDKKTVTIEGTVTKYEWANPHVYIYVGQPTSSGQTIEWEIEASPPSILRRLGWSQETLHVGDVITVIGRPARDAKKRSLLPNSIKHGDALLFERKTELTQLASAGDAPSPSTKELDLGGVWVTLLSLDVEKKLDEKKMSLTPKGAAALKRFDEKKMHPGAECVAFSAPFFMITPDLKRISRGDGVVLIDGAFDAAQRIVHLDVSTHEDAPASIQGHSIGRWEGKSLIIDTTRFTDHPLGNAYGVPSGVRKQLLERLTPDEDGKGLTYHFKVTDPEFLAAPIEGDVRWVFRPDLEYIAETCNPQNARRFMGH